VVLDQDADEALHRAENRAMQHHRRFAAIVLIDKLRIQTHRQVEIQLDRAALPQAAEAVFQRELDLWSVECTLAGLNVISQTVLLQADARPASALSQVSSEPTRFSGRVDNLTSTSLKPKSRYTSFASR